HCFCVCVSLWDADRAAIVVACVCVISALGEIALKAGIETIIGNFDSAMLRLYRRLGCEVDVLSSTQRYGRPIYLGLFPIAEPILIRVKAKLPDAKLAMMNTQKAFA